MYDAKIINQAARNIAKQITGVHASCIMANAEVLADECNRIVNTGAPVALTEVQTTSSATDETSTDEPSLDPIFAKPTEDGKLKSIYNSKTIFRTIGE